MKELVYKHYEDMKLFEPSDEEYDLHFSQIPKESRGKFAYVKGRVLSRNINKKMVRFTDNALKQAEQDFKPSPMLIEHNASFKDMIGTITSFELNDSGLDYFSAIPLTEKNKHYIQMMESDFAGIIKTSIGGRTTSITCSICGEELFKDDQHRYGRKYGGKLAFGNVNTWKTKEVSLTIFPADEDTSASVYTTGFSELDDILMNDTPNEGENLINEDTNINGELIMTGEGETVENNGLDKDAVLELVQSSMPDLEGFATKDDVDGIKTMLSELVNARNEEKEAKLSSMRLELSKLTGKDVELYAEFSENALNTMLEREREIQQGIPDERGVVDSNNKSANRKVKVTPDVQKEAARIILGIQPTSDKVKEHYGLYSSGRRVDVYDRLEKELALSFSEEEEEEGDN